MSKPQYTGKDPRKCPVHNFWKRKPHGGTVAVCEMCALEADKRQKQNELTGGSNKPPVKVGKI